MAISPLPAHGAAWDTWAADIDAAARGAALASDVAATYTNVKVDGAHVTTLDVSSTAVTAADIGADAAGAAATAQAAAQTYATGVAAGLALVFGA